MKLKKPHKAEFGRAFKTQLKVQFSVGHAVIASGERAPVSYVTDVQFTHHNTIRRTLHVYL